MSLTLAVPQSKYESPGYSAKWNKAVKEISNILDGQEYDKWKIADLLVEAIPDGDGKTHTKINKMYSALGGRLDKKTLGSYRRTALAFPPSKRNYKHEDGRPKAFWLYSQCAYHSDRFKFMKIATGEAHLRELIGHRDPYRIANPRVQAALRSTSVMKEIITEDLVETWLADVDVRQTFADHLTTVNDAYVDRSISRDKEVISLLKYLANELRFSKYFNDIEDMLHQFDEYDIDNISYAKYIY